LISGRDDLLAVGFNAVLVTGCWFLLPDSIPKLAVRVARALGVSVHPRNVDAW
jgi:hypothetical protein